MNTTIDLKTAKTIEAMNQKINHMDNAVTDFFNKMSDVLERQLGDDEVYAAVIAPEIELTITPLANVRSYLPCFDETDSCYSISEDVPLALCYDPRQGLASVTCPAQSSLYATTPMAILLHLPPPTCT